MKRRANIVVIKNSFNEQCITPGQMDLISSARIFFRRYTTWLRAYILSRYTGVGTAEELFGRIYLETTNFGDFSAAKENNFIWKSAAKQSLRRRVFYGNEK